MGSFLLSDLKIRSRISAPHWPDKDWQRPIFRLGPTGIEHGKRTAMNGMLLNLYVKFQALKNDEEGQDMIEYALVVALIALGATTALNSLAGGISTAFTSLSSKLVSAM